MQSRRGVLESAAGAVSLALVGTAGCLSAGGGDDADDDGDDDADDDGGDDGTDGSGPAPSDPDAPLVTTVDRDAADEDDEDAEEIVLATYGDVDGVGEIDTDQRGRPYLPVAFTDAAAASFVDDLAGIGGLAEPTKQELDFHLEGAVVSSYALSRSLAETMDAGEWDGTFRIVSETAASLEDIASEFES